MGAGTIREVRAQAPAAKDWHEVFEKRDVMIPTRDGVRLNTAIYTPKNATGPLPILFERTPYGIGEWQGGSFDNYMKALAEDGYIFVFQDIRGRFKSEGTFVMQRAPRKAGDAKAIDEGTDTYDTIEWLVKNVANNNGRVGMLGISYPGWLVMMGLLEPHPALKAASPQASPADMFLGDDFHHNGAFRLSYGFEYAALLESSKENYQFEFDTYDTYEWYLKLGALSNANTKYFHNKLPTWNDFVNHPNYDEFWQQQAFPRHLRNLQLTVPTLSVAGWWDQEDFYGPQRIYQLLEPNDKMNNNFIVFGPWNHGGWAGGKGESLGRIRFESATGEYYRDNIQAGFFACKLKDRCPGEQPEAYSFRTGENAWHRYDTWPPKASQEKRLYFHMNGKLSFEPPMEHVMAPYDEYVSDPAHPVPYRARPVEATYDPRGSSWYTWLVADQRFVQNRGDVLSYATDTLTEDVTISGNVFAHLFASTSGTDSDWIVKLIDVYPEKYDKEPRMGGFELMISNDVFRGRFRKSFEKPEAAVPNQPAEYVIDLHAADHTFLKGHKIMVQVQSSWFPIIDRNPQKFVPNIFLAKDEDYQKATQRVWRAGKAGSYISLPAMGKE
ncbi:MAG: CocE/NonD family hydrolase [Acidobacteria bacterium]|nr:CocE/NonD family hydrolase [Acidobacteriota bacterium]